jgi:CheY-like chemotaxis protein
LDFLHHRGKYTSAEIAPTPGLILLDLNMPRKDGREALAEIKADTELRRIPVVVMTTSKAPDDIVESYELGGSSFITKPASVSKLANVMRVLAEYWFKTVRLPAANDD